MKTVTVTYERLRGTPPSGTTPSNDGVERCDIDMRMPMMVGGEAARKPGTEAVCGEGACALCGDGA